MLRHVFIVTFLLLGLATLLAPAAESWTRLEGCTLIANPFNDGDSFRVRHDGKEYLFRLYYVDTPENDLEFPQRVREQADYFGIAPNEANEIGQAAANATRERLSSAPFNIITRWHGAQGRGTTPRFYAFVETANGDLAEELVSRGLARVFGVRVTRPDGERATDYRARLLKLEDAARESRVGAWASSRPLGIAPERPHRADMPVVVVPRTVATYSKELPRRRIGELRRNQHVHLVEEFADGWVLIEYESDEGETVEVFCLRWDLSLPEQVPGSPSLRASLYSDLIFPRAR